MNDTPLERLATRASANPFFLGFRLAGFACVHELNDHALAAHLGCEPALLSTLRLCRAPRHDAGGFREDVMCVALKFGLNARRLAEAAKYDLAGIAREESSTDSRGVLIAARDRKETS